MFFRRKRKPGAGGPEGSEGGASPDRAEGSGGAGGEDGAAVTTHSTQFLTGEARKDRRNVQVLLEAIARVSESRDLESLLIDIVDRSIRITGAERGLLVMRDELGEAGLAVRVARLAEGRDPEGDDRFSTSIANKVLDEVQPVRATVHTESEALELGRSVYDLKLRAVMCVPLAPPYGQDGVEQKPTGVLYVDSRAATRQFSQQDLSLFAALAHHISIALENQRLHIDSLEKVRLENSLELASVIQRDLMPQIPRDLTGWEVHGWYGPAEQTAGDFYDFVKTKEGKLAIAVGDVTGHGIGPALVSASAQASMRSYLRLLSDPGEVVSLLNQDLCERVEDGRFLTLFLAILAPDGEVQALNAGHALPVVWRAGTQSVETIGRGGPALGMIPDEAYTAHEPSAYAAGDVLVIYTDGLIEARDPQDHDRMFGEEGLHAALREAAEAGKTSQDLCLHLVERAMEVARGIREDDITVVVARRTT